MPLSNKIDFAVIFTVKNANPNGDPLDGNRPRIGYDGIGEVSDVCIKRKMRDRLLEDGQGIFVQSDDRKRDEFTSLKARAESVIDKKMTKQEIIKAACAKWFDVRAFGQLFAFKSSKKDDADGVSIGIRGPVSIHSAFSVAPINVTSIQITKSVNSEDTKDGKKSSDTMGMKHRVDCGTYVFYGSMNPQLAELTGFSDGDAEEIKKIRENKDATDEEKKTAADKETEIENLRKTEHDAVKTYADATPLVRQLIDIALLSGNLLKGEELDKFLKRSVDLLQ